LGPGWPPFSALATGDDDRILSFAPANIWSWNVVAVLAFPASNGGTVGAGLALPPALGQVILCVLRARVAMP
jgi:hypothetical protein